MKLNKIKKTVVLAMGTALICCTLFQPVKAENGESTPVEPGKIYQVFHRHEADCEGEITERRKADGSESLKITATDVCSDCGGELHY